MIAQDKIGHFAVGFTIATIFQFLGVVMILPAILTGLIKELYDKKHGGIFDWSDFVCTSAGGFIAWWFYLIFV